MKTLQKYSAIFLASILTFFGFMAPAHAVLNAGVGTAFTALQTDGLALVDLAWPVVTALTVAFIIIGLFKKAANKAV